MKTAISCALASVLVLACSAGSAGTIVPTSIPTATPSDVVTHAPTSASPTASPSASTSDLRVLVLGDSIAIPEMGCGDCIGFDQQYASYLEEVTRRPVAVDNQARPEAQIDDLQRVLDSEPGVQGSVAAADIIIVSIGFNNGPSWDPEDPCHAPVIDTAAEWIRQFLGLKDDCVAATLAQFETRLDALYGRVEALAAGRAQVRITLGVYANLDGNPGDGTLSEITADEMARAIARYNATIDDWNRTDCAAATAHGFVCGDIHGAFNGPAGSATVVDLVNPKDYVHPNIAGQARIADLLKGIDVSSVTAE